MAPAADIGGKRLIGLAPERWVRWVTGDETAEAIDFPSGEFTWVGRATDVLIKATSPQQGMYLIVNEIQFRPDPRMPLRLRTYAALAEERFGLPVFVVVVNLLPPRQAMEIVDEYHGEIMGQIAHQDFRVINLWEMDAAHVLALNWATLLPFVPVMRGGHDQALVRQSLAMLRADAQLAGMETLLAFFATFVMSADQVRQMMRWDMAMLRESPWYNEIVQEGLEQGLQQGVQQGLQEGKVELLLRLLERRFGRVSENVTLRVRQLSGSQLVGLFDLALSAGSLDEVTWHLDVLLPPA